MLGPFAKCEPPLHCQSPGVASRTPAIAIAGGVQCPQRQRVTEGTAMAPWNWPNEIMPQFVTLLLQMSLFSTEVFMNVFSCFGH